MQKQVLADAVERGKAVEERFETLRYTRLVDSVDGYPRGSVILEDGTVIPGYPSIGRVQSLAAGLERHFGDAFWAEEKIDGFNVRIARYKDDLYAFSRGGFVCPFSTDRLPDLLDATILDDEPHLVLCAEIAGPENPYLEGCPPDIKEDVALFIFDMMDTATGHFLHQEHRMARLDYYTLPAARIFGRYGTQDVEPLRELILALDARGSEGLVFKAEREDVRAKYVTGRSNIVDIALCGDQLLDLPPEYFTNRLMRLALFASEHGQMGDAALERQLGQAFIEGLGRAINRSREHGRVGIPFRCRFRRRRNAELFMAHMKATGGRRVHIAEDMPRREGDYWRLEFERELERMTGTLANTLAGGAQFD
ncbi:RNA ligase [Aquisalimonas asiatica]|uniref:Putative ATP-dependent DNA ligase n=1 Tax=Aquisalimonas asiatica TaxID=406100 RepID=A0A1H8V100_9GAMM|nr:RNA ligase [Aquisalimonas asiatica]SEP08913.1 putative ATP-dependent DNA ligase [Aquisalimonas asiatica]